MEGEEAVALRGPAAALAGYMDESLKIPTATSFRTLSVAVLDAQRRQINADLKAAGRSEKLSFTHLIAWAIIRAVSSQPVMGTGFNVVDGKPHKLVREASTWGWPWTSSARTAAARCWSRWCATPRPPASRASARRSTTSSGARAPARSSRTSCAAPRSRLTNPGGIGTIASVPRLMPGQGTIVATGAIGYPPGLASVPADTLRELGVEKVMTMTSTYDHRVIQGAESGAFLAEIDGFLQGADGFYDDVRASIGLAPGAPIVKAAPAAAPAAPAPAAAGGIDEALLEGVAAAVSVVKAHRSHGHLAAQLDPLGSTPPGDPALPPETVGLTPEMMARIPASLLRVKVPGESFAAALPRAAQGLLRHDRLRDRAPLRPRQAALAARRDRVGPLHPDPVGRAPQARSLARLVEVDAFERFLRRTYLGQKTFSIEGVDALVSITDEVIELVGDEGAAEVVMGMAHRGRLAFISRVVGRPPESILAEFEGHMAFESGDEEVRETAGDVKYHLGAEGTYTTRNGRTVTGEARRQPEPPRAGQRRRRGPHARPARPTAHARAARSQPGLRGADPDPRRRRLHRPGRRGGDAQPAGAARLHAPAAPST